MVKMLNFVMCICPQFKKKQTNSKEHKDTPWVSSSPAQVSLIIPQRGSQDRGVVSAAGGAELRRKESHLPRLMV